jgi:hypothetical protein
VTDATAPWTRRRVTASVVADGLAAAVLVAAWVAVSGEADVRAQLGWFAVAVVALAGVELHGVLGHPMMRRLTVEVPTDLAVGRGVVAGARMTHFHTADCSLARGKAVRAVAPASVARRGLRPCDICEPVAP